MIPPETLLNHVFFTPPKKNHKNTPEVVSRLPLLRLRPVEVGEDLSDLRVEARRPGEAAMGQGVFGGHALAAQMLVLGGERRGGRRGVGKEGRCGSWLVWRFQKGFGLGELV